MNARQLPLLVGAVLLLGACAQSDPVAPLTAPAAPSADGGTMMGSGNNQLTNDPLWLGTTSGTAVVHGTEDGGVMTGSGN